MNWRGLAFKLALPLLLVGVWAARDLMHPPIDPLDPPADTVILMVLDGVRPDELMAGADPNLLGDDLPGPVMPHLMHSMTPEGVFIGSDTGAAAFGLGNPMGISIPGYQSMFTGRLTACVTNSCAPPRGGSLITDIMSAAGVQDDFGFFSSYGQICASLGIGPGTPNVLCGPPRGPDLPDADVFAAAMAHLSKARSRFIFIGLSASDRVGHSGEYDGYLDVLMRYDGYLRQLDTALADLRAAGHRTTLLVTTDHGRGQGAEWTEHRWNVAGSGRLWLFATGHGIATTGLLRDPHTASLYDIRATVNHLLGLPPPKGPIQGRIMTRILDAAPGKADGQ